MLEQERPVVFKDERIGLIRTVPVNYEIFTEDEEGGLRKTTISIAGEGL